MSEKLTKLLIARVSDEEFKMAQELRGSPSFVNVSEYIRASIRHLHKNRIKKKKQPSL